MTTASIPVAQGLYDPRYEHDACGVGFVADLKNRKAHDIIRKALRILVNLEHRGACGCETNTGDGAGVLLQTPHGFLARECERLGISLPAPADRAFCERAFEQIIREEGQAFLGWRDVPTDNSMIGLTAKSGEPVMRQV